MVDTVFNFIETSEHYNMIWQKKYKTGYFSEIGPGVGVWEGDNAIKKVFASLLKRDFVKITEFAPLLK